MDAWLYLLGVVLAAIGIGASIGLHEIGHLVPAKRFGVRVTQYMVGFGPTLWSKRRGETEYGVKWIPLGGYIRMIGMYPPPHGTRTVDGEPVVPGRFAAMAEDARIAAWEEVRPGDEDRVFYKLSVPRKIVVMLGGPTMNLLIAFVLFGVLLVGVGLPTATTQVRTVSPCLPAAMASEAAAARALADPASAAWDCTAGDPRSPAVAAGLQPGDTIVAVDGTAVESWSALTDATRARPGSTATLTVRDLDGATRDLQVAVATSYRPVTDADGVPTGEIQVAGYVGVVPERPYVRQPLSAVPARLWDLSVRTGEAMLGFPQRVAELAQTLLTDEPRDPRSPISVVGVGRISGEIAAAADPIKAKAVTLLSILAALNLFLFLFNLLPLLPLDGGHVAGALWEGLRRWLARLRGREDPGPVDVARALPLAYAVFVALVAVSSIVILADIIKPISLT